MGCASHQFKVPVQSSRVCENYETNPCARRSTERGQLCPRELMGEAMHTAHYAGKERDRPGPSAGIRAQDLLTWTRGQRCPRSNNASADTMKIAKRPQPL